MQTNNNTANIIEIFSSIQGEGPYIGYKQLFIRFAGCNLGCNYCDTNFIPDKTYSVYAGKETVFESNPVSISSLIQQTLDFHKTFFHSISLTGGEPLLHADFLNSYVSEVKRLIDTMFYLETNGILYDQLEIIINNIDIVSMDIKLESSTGVKPDYIANSRFIELVKAHNKEIFAKVVVTSLISEEETVRVAELCSLFQVPLIIQPVTSLNPALTLTSDKIIYLIDQISKIHSDVRLIPQTHLILGLQ
jgi:organic radical activating enzyme